MNRAVKRKSIIQTHFGNLTMQLSEHFTLEEFVFSSIAVRWGIDNTPSDSIVQNLTIAAAGMEQVRGLLNSPIHVDSGYRCPKLNEKANGSKDSDHMNGWCADFICSAFGTPLDIVKAIIASGIKFDKCIMEGTWVHISFNPLLRGLTLTAHFDKNGKVSYTSGV